MVGQSSTKQATAAAPGSVAPGAGYEGAARLLDAPNVSNPGPAWALGKENKQLRYPDWFEGTWEVQWTLRDVQNPRGRKYITRNTPGVTKGSMAAGVPDIGAGQGVVTFRQRFVREDKPPGGVVLDRPFSVASTMDAHLGPNTARSVAYDPAADPTRLAVVYATPRRDGGTDLRKAEIFVNNRGGGSSGETFAWFEAYRQVSQAARQGGVGDYLMAQEWTRGSDGGSARGRLRCASFLQPQDALYFEVGNDAVGLYDYDVAARKL
ncbi:unnamed protein product [Pedinophyceae sp. YPF-701]|nr:unnamed protein product [Pedinophyceae sp. YPF-701]